MERVSETRMTKKGIVRNAIPLLFVLGSVLLSGKPLLAAPEGSPGPVEGPGTVHSLSRWVIPRQTTGWVGVQGRERDRPLTVTPGNRFLSILHDHAAWYASSRRAVGLSTVQRRKVNRLLADTRNRLVRLDGKDLALVQLFEAGAVAPRVDVSRLGQLNEKIGAVEGEEAQVFVTALSRFQKLLLPLQRREGEVASRNVLPDMSVDLSGAVFFADRILSIRWNRLENTLEQSGKKPDDAYVRAFQSGRKKIWSLGIRKTVGDKEAMDLLKKPWVDLAGLSRLEKKNGPVEATFWKEFLHTLGTLNPPSGS
ncbi:hypothetical protein LptCag_1007 [Leptospirillum ferriphilum]|jgi:hypothetical protein|uniref:Uncharacterized protein n=3 Tax=Leptospirillum TaxID=179 RepID=A0A094X6Q2_9BACT|nr:MAG: Protein of unknown function [Leptospirillum sp. Group II '5-way CG']KGA94244.1 hypothetical protein LptCag_1007 [Leptospirillum ferriphilum]